MQERRGFPKDEVVLTFHNSFGPEELLPPYTVQNVAELAKAGKKHIAVMAILENELRSWV